jgi:hypothetical protein
MNKKTKKTVYFSKKKKKTKNPTASPSSLSSSKVHCTLYPSFYPFKRSFSLFRNSFLSVEFDSVESIFA